MLMKNQPFLRVLNLQSQNMSEALGPSFEKNDEGKAGDL